MASSNRKLEVKLDEVSLDKLVNTVKALDERIERLVALISKVEIVTEKARKVTIDLNKAIDKAGTQGRKPFSGKNTW